MTSGISLPLSGPRDPGQRGCADGVVSVDDIGNAAPPMAQITP
ncbi:hypothetical protein [Gordonia sp. NPDC003950]